MIHLNHRFLPRSNNIDKTRPESNREKISGILKTQWMTFTYTTYSLFPFSHEIRYGSGSFMLNKAEIN